MEEGTNMTATLERYESQNKVRGLLLLKDFELGGQ